MPKNNHIIAKQFVNFVTTRVIEIDKETMIRPREIMALIKRLVVLQKMKGKADILLTDLVDDDKLLVARLARWYPSEDEYGRIPVQVTDLSRSIIRKWDST